MLLLVTITLSFLLLLPLAASQPSLSISVGTDQAEYRPGATVHISGGVLNNQRSPVEGAAVSVQVNDPQSTPVHVSLLYTDHLGNYSDSFALSSSPPLGKYTIFASASATGLSGGQAQTQFSVAVQTTTSTKQSSSTTTTTSQQQPNSKCLIATATYGSEIAPEVVMLRTFRDSRVLQTRAGREFMLAFNTFYYAFSPIPAKFISSHPNVRGAVKIALYPLIIILAGAIQVDHLLTPYPEAAISMSGLMVAFGLGFVYLGIPVTLLNVKKDRSLKYGIFWPVLICVVSVSILAIGELLESSALLLVSSTTSMLGFAVLGSLSLSELVNRFVRRLNSNLSTNASASLSSPSSTHRERPN